MINYVRRIAMKKSIINLAFCCYYDKHLCVLANNNKRI